MAFDNEAEGMLSDLLDRIGDDVPVTVHVPPVVNADGYRVTIQRESMDELHRPTDHYGFILKDTKKRSTHG